MKKTSSTVVFFGNESLATGVKTNAPVLKALIESGYDVRALVVSQKDFKSRSQRELEVEKIAKANNIEIIRPQKLITIKSELENFQAQAAVLVAFGKIIPKEIIDIFPRGIINVHPSLLPKGRGPTPLEQVILDGSRETGVSIMNLAAEMDAGAVYAQSRVALSASETKQELADKLLIVGSKLIIEKLPDILSGKLKSTPQDDSKASYNKLIKKSDGVINWESSADQLEREIRAFAIWPKSRTTIGGQEIIIASAKVLSSTHLKPAQIEIDKSKIKIGCGSGALLITRLQPINKPEMNSQAFLAGYKRLFN